MSTNTQRIRWSAAGDRERRLVHPAAALALCLAGCNAPTVTGPGDAAVDLAAPGPDLGGFLDFPATPQIDPSLPGDIADQFQRPAAGALAAPCLSEPTIGALYPRNFSPPLFEWTAAAQANVFELRLRIGNQAHELVIYTPDNRYQMPIDLWQRLSTHSAGQAITISLRAAVLTAGLVSAPATAAQAVAAPAAVGGMEHGDHNPHHGGVVYMYDDMHYEVVLAPDGHHRVYFTDAVREDLPASVASSVTLTVERPKGQPESLTGAIDESGESWLLTGQPVADKGTSVRVAFVAKGTPYWIDVPFIPPTQ